MNAVESCDMLPRARAHLKSVASPGIVSKEQWDKLDHVPSSRPDHEGLKPCCRRNNCLQLPRRVKVTPPMFHHLTGWSKGRQIGCL